MEEFQIETAQNVTINQNVAGLGDRILGYIIDSVAVFVYLIGINLLLIKMDVDMRDLWALYLLVSLPAFLYYVLLETFWNGKTLGKYVMKTRVVKLDGSNASFANYFVRWILRIVDISLTSGGVAVLSILIKGNGQRVGDIAAGTTVISEKRKVSIEDTLLKEIEEDYMPSYSQVTVFKDSEMQTIKNLYESARRNGQHNIILQLHNRLVEVMEVTPKETPVEFIGIVIKDYNYFTQKI
ncbi:RDD family protein [Oceanihabitans sediminis]|uniref:RDD family protein n=1 Tax=Oceanihabitans sediminis TaxID=1812012 RepID=A0A368P4P4_9FLAO|nr:RDD family protein [Oceanihabitans sediminis]MDX1277414.1 RDD family protein [Oceanihabitans sediminis]MDX1774211.1 RDD family protein [Oceanihabitans sediminis]RBP30779.1 putative RDD family membrane protein YckC [Oceanihabitans sediminis]RCU56749.1 RDD family protein [Oceanihabitans sediminis]